jgi:hypothetical protein
MVGIREVQDEKQNPERKKKILRKTLCFFFTSMKNPVIQTVTQRKHNRMSIRNGFEKELLRF